MVDFFSLFRRVAAVALTTVLMSSQALTMTLVRVGPALYASGPVTDKDYVQFKDALATGGVQRVVFVNSPGGDLWTGLQIGRMIRDAGLETRVSGHCHSACSIMFLGGR
ncbi:MAG: hypothetical protein ACO3ZK_17250, partial [Rubrivivax sp.]